MNEVMEERPAIYRHLNDREYDCTILLPSSTIHFMRLPASTARELKLAEELWLPASYINVNRELKSGMENQ